MFVCGEDRHIQTCLDVYWPLRITYASDEYPTEFHSHFNVFISCVIILINVPVIPDTCIIITVAGRC